MECTVTGSNAFPEARGPFHIGEPITGIEFLECLAENRADWRMDSVASFNIPYTDDVRDICWGGMLLCMFYTHTHTHTHDMTD